MSFSMNVNLAEVAPAGQVQKSLPTGLYPCRITKCFGKNKNGKNTAVFILEVTDGDCKGITSVTSLLVAQSKEDGSVYFWRALAESCGYTQDEIIEVSSWEDYHFLDKECQIRYTAGNKEEGIWSKTSFLSSESYEIALAKDEKAEDTKKLNSLPSTTINTSPKIDVSAPPQGTKDSLNNLVSNVSNPFD